MALHFIRTAGRLLRLRRQIRRASRGSTTPVIIFQMGKVASSTIEASLEDVPGIEVFRAHRLDEKGKRTTRRALERRWVTTRIIQTRRPAKVVTLVREPVGRNVSAYFQNLDDLWGMENAARRLSPEELVRGFFEKFNHQRALQWFDVEFRPALGVDVYAQPFPQDTGFLRFQSGPYDVLIMQAGLADTVKECELARLVGVPALKLVQKNVGDRKSYSGAYKRFLDTARLPASYLNEMLDSKFARHFFSASELEAVRERWTRGGETENALGNHTDWRTTK